MENEKKLRLAAILHGVAAVLGVICLYLFMMSAVSYFWQSLFIDRSGGTFSEEELVTAFNRDSGYINIIFAAFCLLVAAMYYGAKKRSLTDAANIRTASPIKMGTALLAGAAFQLPLGFLVSLIPFPEEILQGYDELMNASTTPMAVQVLYGIVLAPVIEEIFFRGIAHDRLARGIHPTLAAVISSAAFAVIHGEPLSILAAFTAGVILALIYNRYRTVLVPIAFHMGFNAAAFGAEYIPDGKAGFAMVIASAVLFVGALVVLFWRRKRKNSDKERSML